MKKIFLLSITSLAVIVFILIPFSVFAIDYDAGDQGPPNPAEAQQMQAWERATAGSSGGAGVALVDPITGKTGGNLNSIDLLVERLIKYVLGVSGVAALIAFVYGGVMWLISLGDTAKIAKGKNIMVWALMGLVVMFGAYAIVALIFGALGLR